MAFLALGGVVAGCAQVLPNTPQDDAELVRRLVAGNLTQIAAGDLAFRKTDSRALRQFARRVVREHTELQREAGELGTVRGVALPADPGPRGEAELRKLREAPWYQAFDRAYLDFLLRSHEETLALLERAGARAADPALRQLAAGALPRVRRNFQVLREIADALKKA